ncbi:MAG: family 20 glycosylhydrolase [Armatimonadota bacterium]
MDSNNAALIPPFSAEPLSTGLPFRVRAIQVDLARQMETVDYLRRYIDFTVAQGYNVLFLYLEGRVRTDTFPFMPKEQSYTLEDMDAVVRHARGANMEVVPGISSLGHAEHFFAYPGLEHLAEERSGNTRFGGKAYTTFCPSKPETYTFLENYMKEIFQVFTSPMVHIGCDEAWNLGYCDLCKPRWQSDGLGAIFTGHLQRMQQIAQGMRKRLWIWDDLYEVFPEEIEQVPRDIVMCHWQYDQVIEPEGIEAHFVNRSRENWLACYEKLGIDALISPRSLNFRNVETFTDYGRRHRVLGGLMTQWEMSSRFHEELLPSIACFGRLWSQPAFDLDAAWRGAVDATLPGHTAALSVAVRSIVSLARMYPRPNIQGFLAGPLSTGEYQQQIAMRTALELLQHTRKERPPRVGTEILTDIEQSARLELLHWTLRDMLPKIYSPRRFAEDTPLLKTRAEEVREELGNLIQERAPLHDRLRPGMYPVNGAEAYLTRLHTVLEAAWERLERLPAENDWWLILRLFLPDAYSAQQLQVTGLFDAEERVLAQGVFKPAIEQNTGCHYTLQAPFKSPDKPKAVRLESWGYGGQGIAFLEMQNPTVTLFPKAIRETAGPVSDPDALLHDNSLWTYLGRLDVSPAMNDPSLAEEHAVVVVELAERE